MPTGTRSRPGADADEEAADAPEIAVHESSPGTAVFVESGNTDGWIASDTPVETNR
jgi:hypothetical protein